MYYRRFYFRQDFQCAGGRNIRGTHNAFEEQDATSDSVDVHPAVAVVKKRMSVHDNVHAHELRVMNSILGRHAFHNALNDSGVSYRRFS